MSEVKYKITAPGSTNCMIATYKNGELSALDGIHHMAKMWENWCINAPVPLLEKLIPGKLRTFEGLINIEVIELSKNDAKIALFCIAYKKHFGISYRRNLADITAMRNVDVSEDLLELYFNNKEWWGKQPKSIRNYAKNYNSLLQLKNKPTKKEKKETDFPDHYDASLMRKLKGPEISAYWKHLRSLGFEPVKSATGNIIDWKKAGMILVLLMFTLVSCMTPKKVKKYIANYPEILQVESDTTYRSDTIRTERELIIPEDSIQSSWGIWWQGDDKDSAYTIPDTSMEWFKIDPTSRDSFWIINEGPHSDMSLKIWLQNEPEEIDKPSRTKFHVTAKVKPDTIMIRDTIPIQVPMVREKVVIVRAGWKTKLLWAGVGLLLCLIIGGIWRRKK